MYPELIEQRINVKKEIERAFGYKFPISWNKFNQTLRDKHGTKT
jgi:hypothetical protein